MEKLQAESALTRLRHEREVLLAKTAEIDAFFEKHSISSQLAFTILQKVNQVRQLSQSEKNVQSLRDLDFLILSFKGAAHLSLRDLLSYLRDFTFHAKLPEALDRINRTLEESKQKLETLLNKALSQIHWPLEPLAPHDYFTELLHSSYLDTFSLLGDIIAQSSHDKTKLLLTHTFSKVKTEDLLLKPELLLTQVRSILDNSSSSDHHICEDVIRGIKKACNHVFRSLVEQNREQIVMKPYLLWNLLNVSTKEPKSKLSKAIRLSFQQILQDSELVVPLTLFERQYIGKFFPGYEKLVERQIEEQATRISLMYESSHKVYLEVGQLFIEHIFSRFSTQIASTTSAQRSQSFPDKIRSMSELRALLKMLKIITHTHFSEQQSQADINTKIIAEMEEELEKGYESLVEIVLKNNGSTDEENKDTDSLRLALLAQLKGTQPFQRDK